MAGRHVIGGCRFAGGDCMSSLLWRGVAFAAGAAMAVLSGGPGSAADLSIPTPPPAYPAAYQPAAPAVARFTWTGCYGGLNGGGLWVRDDSTLAGPSFPGSPPVGTSLGGHSASGWLAGFQMGCDYQVGNWVFGAEGGFSWPHATGSHPDPFFPTTDSSSTRQLMEGTWRAGYALDRFLGYVKAGGAWERMEYSMVNTTVPYLSAAGSRETGGWIVGIGGEYALTKWLSAFIEYDYLDFGTCTQTFVNPFLTLVANVNIRDYKDLVKAGLNVRF